MRINSLKCKTISAMNGSGAGHSKKTMLLGDYISLINSEKTVLEMYY